MIVAQPIGEVNLRRLERELVLAYETGAEVTVVLTKADLVADESRLADVRDQVRALVGPDVGVLVMSADAPASVEAVRALIPAGVTAVLIGRSGVGKSSLVNLLLGSDVHKTAAVREGTARAVTPRSAAEIVDLREAGAWSTCPACAAWAFGTLTRASRRRSRTSRKRPPRVGSAIASTRRTGCAVRAAVESGAIAPGASRRIRRCVRRRRP